MLMAVHTTATAQNLVASDDGTIKSVAVGRHILVAPEDTLLRIDWEEVPQMQNDGIYRSVVVSTLNAPQQDLTLIVIAVNEFGKAFVLNINAFGLSTSLGILLVPACPRASTLCTWTLFWKFPRPRPSIMPTVTGRSCV